MRGLSQTALGVKAAMACKISQFIMQLIVVGKGKTTKRAGNAQRTVDHCQHSE